MVSNRSRPALIRILAWLTIPFSVAMFLSIALALLGIGPTIMGGEHVTRANWLHVAAPLVATIGTLMALISYGFTKEKRWSRHLVVGMFVFIIVYALTARMLDGIPARIMWRALLNATFFAGLSIWYFYFKPNVAAYFAELRSR